VRETCRNLAADGRTVFISSHLMSEMALTADHLIIIGRGKILTQGPVQEVIASAASDTVRIVSPSAPALAEAMSRAGLDVRSTGADSLMTTAPAARVGEIAAAQGIVLHELHTQHASLEEAYLELTGGEVEYATGQAGQAPAMAPAATHA